MGVCTILGNARGSADGASIWPDICQGRFVLLWNFTRYTSHVDVVPSVLSSVPVCSCDLFGVVSRHSALVGFAMSRVQLAALFDSVWFEPACCLLFGRGSAGLIRIGIDRFGLVGPVGTSFVWLQPLIADSADL